MIWSIASILKASFLPPLGLGWLLLLAWLLFRRRPRTARWLLGATLVLGYLAATPAVSAWLMRSFVVDEKPAATAKPQAIVILGGGRGLVFDAQGAPQAGFVVGGSLERILTGAQLHKATRLPVLVTGGNPDGYLPPEGEAMQVALERDFGVPVRWAEKASRNTVENAQFSAPMLRAGGVESIYLVTNDYHMRRARTLFEAQGFAVTPVTALRPLLPDGRMMPSAPQPLRLRDWVPSMSGAMGTYLACNEIAGMVYARMNMR